MEQLDPNTGRQHSGRQLRIAYVSGPTDAAQIYSEHRSGRTATYFGTNYMLQFLLLAEELDAEAWIETWHNGPSYTKRVGDFTFHNVREFSSRGAVFHFQQFALQLLMIVRIARFRPDVLILTGKQDYWWMYSPLKMFGVKFLASFHAVPWTRFHPLKPHLHALRWLNSHFSWPILDAAVVTSKEIADQIAEGLGRRAGRVPIFYHLPSYRPEQFRGIDRQRDSSGNVFRVMFMGRIEENKGVFDILDIAEQLHRMRPGEFRFEICGEGSDRARLEDAIAARDLRHVVTCHGYCEPGAMRQVMSICHIVVVPTRSDLTAGFEMTCAEAILSGRPLVTSAVCPALHYLRPAAIEVAPDDVEQYRRAIEQLKDDSDLFRSKQAACESLSAQFFDYAKSWDAAMRDALRLVLGAGSDRDKTVRQRSIARLRKTPRSASSGTAGQSFTGG